MVFFLVSICVHLYESFEKFCEKENGLFECFSSNSHSFIVWGLPILPDSVAKWGKKERKKKRIIKRKFNLNENNHITGSVL